MVVFSDVHVVFSDVRVVFSDVQVVLDDYQISIPHTIMCKTKPPMDENMDHVSTLSCSECACTKLRTSKEGT